MDAVTRLYKTPHLWSFRPCVVAFVVSHDARPEGYEAGATMAAYKIGSRKMILNTSRILENINRHPSGTLPSAQSGHIRQPVAVASAA